MGTSKHGCAVGMAGGGATKVVYKCLCAAQSLSGSIENQHRYAQLISDLTLLLQVDTCNGIGMKQLA